VHVDIASNRPTTKEQTVTDLYNPMLDDDEDDVVNSGPVNPLLEDEDDEPVVTPKFTVRRPTDAPTASAIAEANSSIVVSQPWIKPVRSAEAEVAIEALKCSGDVPSGKKKTRLTLTQKDMTLLGCMAWGRYFTASQLSMMLTTAGVHGNEAGKMASPKTALNRLISLRHIGAVEDVTLWNGVRIWGLTNYGRGAAIASGLVGRDGQVHPKGLKGVNYTTVSHGIAVNQVAAQLLSPFSYFRDVVNLPEQINFNMLISEYEVNNAWLKTNARLAAENKAARLLDSTAKERKFKDWRTETIKAMHADAQAGKINYRDIAAAEPALWALGQTPVDGAEFREHHLPDLIINLESFRRGPARGSIAVEVELVSKSVSSYRKQLKLYAADLVRTNGYPEPLLLSKLIYATNDSLVIENLTEADAKENLNLISSGKLVFVPVTDRDGVTPINLTTRV
jgi:hypothetical protein